MSDKKIALIGVGNKLMGDEGVGIHAIEWLRTQKVPEKYELLDGGTGGMTLLHILEEYAKAIIIDAADFGGKPGEIRKVKLEDVNLGEDASQISLHGISFAGILQFAKTLDKKIAEITLILVQPKIIGPSLELSDECKKAIPKIKQLVSNF